MNTTEFAKAEGVNYQTVSRIVRRLLAEDGKKAIKGQNFEFTPEFEQRVRAKLGELKAARERAEERRKAEAQRAITKKVIRSTEAQRRDWTAIWSADFMASTDRETWADFACVLASIEHSRFPGWLSERFGQNHRFSGYRVGDLVLKMALEAGADTTDLSASGHVGGYYSGFTAWLINNGFEDPGRT